MKTPDVRPSIGDGAVTIILFLAKMWYYSDLSWWIVFAPLWFMPVLFVTGLTIVGTISVFSVAVSVVFEAVVKTVRGR